MKEKKYYISLFLPTPCKTEIFRLIAERDQYIEKQLESVPYGQDFTASAIIEREMLWYDERIADTMADFGR